MYKRELFNWSKSSLLGSHIFKNNNTINSKIETVINQLE